MNFISKLFSKIKAMLGFSSNIAENVQPFRPEEPTNIGVYGQIDAELLVLRDQDRMIIYIDYDFKDVLGWVEWDVKDNRIDLVQKSGAVADLGSIIPANDVEDFRDLNKVFVITRYNQEKIMHNLSLIIRE
jgi:hypothetical protein